jgi:hypothetical protein
VSGCSSMAPCQLELLDLQARFRVPRFTFRPMQALH